MPKLNPVGIFAASLAFFFIGFLWYAVIFADAWMAAQNLPAQSEDAGNPLWMVVGFFITVMQTIGLALVLKWKGVAGPADAAKTAALLWALFALPFTAYGYIYSFDQSEMLFAIDASHILVGWVVAAAILAKFK